MNAMTKFFGRGQDGAVSVPTSQLEQYYADVLSFQASKARAARRGSRTAWTFGAVMLGINGALAFGLMSVLPTVRLVPVFIYPHADGTVDSAVSLSQLPVSQQDAVVQSELWQYAMLRESYAADTANYAYHVVSAMSAPAVRAQYQAWFNYPNPQSPQVSLAKRGTISVERVSGSYIAPGVYRIEFRKTVTLDDAKPVTSRWVTTMHFARTDTVPATQRVQFNPAGVIVTAYPGAEQEGAP
jgi:type IV secretion system protein VirB8